MTARYTSSRPDPREDHALEIAHAHPAQEQETMKTDDVPEWAIERARALRDGEATLVGGTNLMAAFAAHEPAPVDPLLIEARAIVADCLGDNEKHEEGEVLAGDWDEGHRIRIALAALKRGIELRARGVTLTAKGE